MRIYIFKNDTTWGPYNLAQIQEFLEGGNINANDLAAKEGGSQWTPLMDLVRIEVPPPPFPGSAIDPMPMLQPTARAPLARPPHGGPYRSLCDNKPSAGALRYLIWALYIGFGILPLVAGISWSKLAVEESNPIGGETKCELDFIGGIGGQWRGDGVLVKENALVLNDGNIVNWKFERVWTQESQWGGVIVSKRADNEHPEHGWIGVVLPNDIRLAGHRVSFGVNMKVTRPESRADSKGFKDVSFEHSQQCEIAVGRKPRFATLRRLATPKQVDAITAFGGFVTLLGVWLLLNIVKARHYRSLRQESEQK